MGGSSGLNAQPGSRNMIMERLQPFITSIRPWGQFFDNRQFIKPSGNPGEVMPRVKKNLEHYKGNYAISLLGVSAFIVFLHPGTLFVVGLLASLWGYALVIRNEPFVVQNHELSPKEVTIILAAASFAVVFLLTNVGSVLLFGASLGAVGVLAHAAARRNEEVDVEAGFFSS
eukprot:TRINITY_DN1277_c0_g1::TRINITY_DN1277_c0_g1_i1::g.26911::m.26911 TRINITY_DN1277_c0_g1::TRINITY_DN1277_c0_g1_i1::g.26911  ORF type:complete len:172 (-),score=4.99,sp/Q9C889/PR1F2_ARATH/32.45/9e-18,PRA1/PF03208.14/8.2e-34 TRINITY_DN1277_c0_g1_i1:36-551(-)